MKKFLGLILLASACSNMDVKNSENPEEIYNAAVQRVDDENYLEGKELLDEVKNRFPQSRFAALAELKGADAAYKQENYIEAAAIYGVFVQLYPNHAQAPYAMFQKAQSHLNDAPDKIARDQAPAKEAMETAEQMARRYPQSEYAPKAEELRKKARLKLAEKEAYVARFYESRDAEDSAYKRWRGMTLTYGDLREYADAKSLFEEADKKLASLKPAPEPSAN